jgi:hypothetical protein
LLGATPELHLQGDPRLASDKPRLPAATVLDVSAGVPAADASANAATAARFAHAVSTNISQFRARRDYAGLSARIAADSSPEALYLKAAIYARCARRDGRSMDERAEDTAARRATFIAGLAEGNADTPVRIDAYDRLAIDPCAGLDLGAFDQGSLARMLAAAADAGNPVAQAWQLASGIEVASQGQRGYAMDAAAFGQVQQLLATGDPDVIRNVQGLLSSSLASGGVRLDGAAIDPEAMHAALTLLACDAGGECGSDSTLLLEACAFRGQCAAGTVYEYSYFYGHAPNESQLAEAYRQALLGMLAAHDLSGLTYSPTDDSSGYPFLFMGEHP